MQNKIKVFENKQVRTLWNADEEEWYFSVVDVCNVLADSASKDPGAYWRKLKQRLKNEGSEVVTNCHGLKMQASDGKMRETDCLDTKGVLRLVQSIPSPKAEPFKMWLAQVGSERLEEIADPENRLAEELGSGVRNIVKYSKVYFGTTPEFIGGDVFKTKISLNGINRSDVGVNVGVKLSETERKVLECVKENGEFSAEEIAERIKRGKRTMERAIKSMKEHGVIERVGSDKAGCWKVVN